MELTRRQRIARIPGVVLILVGIVALFWSTLPWWSIASYFVLGVIFTFPRPRKGD